MKFVLWKSASERSDRRFDNFLGVFCDILDVAFLVGGSVDQSGVCFGLRTGPGK